MAKITKTYESDIDLTVYTVVGEITFDEVWEQTQIFHLNGKPSRLALWDFSLGTLALLSSKKMGELVYRTVEISKKIEGGKAAILAPDITDYGIGRIFQALSDTKDFPLETQIFRDMNTAKKWLMSKH